MGRVLECVLAGKAQPKDARERLDLALFCADYRERYVTAVGLFADAFAADPRLAANLNPPYRFMAAHFASLAAAGKGEDAANLNSERRAGFRSQALGWLRADLDAYAALAGKVDSRPLVRPGLTSWLKDKALAGVRTEAPLAALPETERKEWRKLWAEVAALLKKIEEK